MIIVEGPQGTGKTSLTSYLRQNISSSNLYALSGQKDKTMSGKKLSEYMYNIQLDYINGMSIVPMDLIFDRTFFTEEVYARLGYKEYSFTDVYNSLLERLCNTNYNIYLFLLYLQNVELYKERLARGQHHQYQKFSIDNSVNQQLAYQVLGHEIEERGYPINVIPLAMDDFSIAYNRTRKLLNIETKEE